MGKVWNKYATIIQSILATTILLSILFGGYFQIALAEHNETPHRDAAPKDDVVLLALQITRIQSTMDKNKEVTTIIQKQNEADHERQNRKLDRILDKLEK